MKKSLLVASLTFLALLGIVSMSHAQVCMSTSEGGKVCLTVLGQPECGATGYAAVTLVQQANNVSVILAGTQVCVLRVIEGSPIAGDPLVVVLAKRVISSGNGSTQIETQEAAFFASQLSGATQSSALTLSK